MSDGSPRVVAVPAAAWLLPAVGVGLPADWASDGEAQRRRVSETLTGLAGQEGVVVLVAGAALRVSAGGPATLVPLGVPDIPVAAPTREPGLATIVADALAAAVDAAPTTPHRTRPPEAVVLVRLLRAVVPDLPVVVVELPPRLDVDVRATLVRALAALATDRPVGMLVPGDLAATLGTESPGYVQADAVARQAALVARIRQGTLDRDVAAALDLAPDAAHDEVAVVARRLVVRGLATLQLAMAVRREAGRPTAPDSLHVAAFRGVGQLVASWGPSAAIGG